MDTSASNIERLAGEHVRRYRNQLERAQRGERGFIISENRELLSIWESIRSKGHRWDALSNDERDEVIDALHDEE